MKKALFYITMIPGAIFMLAVYLTACIPAIYLALIPVVENLGHRYEHWAFDVPRGTFINCPWKTSLWQVFIDEFRP